MKQLKIKEEFTPIFEKAFDEIVSRMSRILLVSPLDPDADSCTSMFAFREFTKWLGDLYPVETEYCLYAPNSPRSNKLFEVEGIKRLGDPLVEIQQEIPSLQFDLAVAFDYGQFSRTGLRGNEAKFFLGLDHHPKCDGFPQNGFEIIEKAASTTALLTRFFYHSLYRPTADVATCLLAGFIADTGRFANTGAFLEEDPFEVPYYLGQCGADSKAVLTASIPEVSLKRFTVQKNALGRVFLVAEKCFSFIWFNRDDLVRWEGTQEDVLSFMGQLRNIKEFPVTVAYYEIEKGRWHCSLRSRPDSGIKVNTIAEHYGGGGHANAAGFDSDKSPLNLLQLLYQEFSDQGPR